MRLPSIFALCVAALTLVSTKSAEAALTFFGNDQGVFLQDGTPTGAGFPNALAARTTFLSNLIGVGTETFESFPDGTAAALALTFPGAGTAILAGGGEVDNDPGTGQNATSGTNWWRTGADNNFSITFTSPVAAFGFYGIDVGDIGAQLTLTLEGGSTVSINIPHPTVAGGPSSPQNGSVFFFGYIDTANPFISATFSNPAGVGDDFGFDDMTIGSVQQVQAVPEPTSFAIFGAAAFFAAASARLRRRTCHSKLAAL
jgi:hypothetical protein